MSGCYTVIDLIHVSIPQRVRSGQDISPNYTTNERFLSAFIHISPKRPHFSLKKCVDDFTKLLVVEAQSRPLEVDALFVRPQVKIADFQPLATTCQARWQGKRCQITDTLFRVSRP